MARSLRKNDSAMLMYSLAVCMRDTDLPPAHAAAVNSFRMSRASFLVGSPMMRDLSAASSGSDRESYILASVFLPLRWMGSGLMSSPLAGHGGAGAVRWRIPGGGCRRGLPLSPRTHPTDGRSLASCLCIKESIDGSNGLSWHPYAFVWRSSEGVRGNLRAGPTGIRCDALAIRRLGLLRTKTKKTARSTHGERHHGRCARPRQPIALHPRRGCARRKPSRTISRPESRHSCTTSQTASATGPRKRRFPNAPTRKR